LWIGHDGRRIGVDQYDPIAFRLEGLAGLRPRIIELARLTYDDRSRPDDEDGIDIRAFGHEPTFYCRSAALAIAGLALPARNPHVPQKAAHAASLRAELNASGFTRLRRIDLDVDGVAVGRLEDWLVEAVGVGKNANSLDKPIFQSTYS